MVSPTIGSHVVCTIQDAALHRLRRAAARRRVRRAHRASTAPARPTGEEPMTRTAACPAARRARRARRAGGRRRRAHARRRRVRRRHLARRRLGRPVHRRPGPTGADGVDPHGHTTKKRISDGVGAAHEHPRARRRGHRGRPRRDRRQRPLPAAGPAHPPRGELLAAHDRDVALGLEGGPSPASPATTSAMTASHNHNTPYYSTPGWGTAIFQDVFDLRFYDYMATRMAKAVIEASERHGPGAHGRHDAHVQRDPGAHVRPEGRRRRHARRPAVQPHDAAAVGRPLDDVSDPARPEAARQLGRLRHAPRVHVGLRPHQRRHHAGRRADGRPRARHDQRVQPARDRHLRPAQGHARARARGAARVPGQRLRPARPRRAAARRRDQRDACATSRRARRSARAPTSRSSRTSTSPRSRSASRRRRRGRTPACRTATPRAVPRRPARADPRPARLPVDADRREPR